MDRRVIGVCVLIGCGAPAPVAEPREQVCTLIGCKDAFWIVIGDGSRGIPVDAHTRVFGSTDGVAFECASVPTDPSRSCSGQSGLRCQGGVDPGEDPGTADSAGSCVHLLRSVSVTGTPKVVEVTFETATASIHRVFQPKYTSKYLNGSDCGATCTRAEDHVPL